MQFSGMHPNGRTVDGYTERLRPEQLAPKGWILFCGASSDLSVLALHGREGPETREDEDRASSKDGEWF